MSDSQGMLLELILNMYLGPFVDFLGISEGVDACILHMVSLEGLGVSLRFLTNKSCEVFWFSFVFWMSE